MKDTGPLDFQISHQVWEATTIGVDDAPRVIRIVHAAPLAEINRPPYAVEAMSSAGYTEHIIGSAATLKDAKRMASKYAEGEGRA